MEITHYLRAVRRRLWIIVLLPLGALAITAAYQVRQPEKYQTSATVIVPALSSKGYSTSAVTQYFSTFKDVLVSKPVVEAVSRQTGVSEKDLVANLTASTASASSNIIQVTFTSSDHAVVTKVADMASRLSLDTLIQPQLSAGQSSLAAAQALEKQASADLQSFTAETGLLIPDEDYRLKAGALSQLTLQLEEARVAGDAPRIAGLQSVITARQKELGDLASQLFRYQRLDDAYKTSVNGVALGQRQVQDTEAIIAANNSPSAVTVPDATRMARLPLVAKAAGIAAAVALALGLAILVLFELIWPTARAVTEEEQQAGSRVAAVSADTAALNGDGMWPGRSEAPVPLPVQREPGRSAGRVRDKVHKELRAGVTAYELVEDQPASRTAT